ncbi:MAG TPA: citrate/2-methylcitrate synthase, partial [Acidimicrobiia bacterium]|nr:citrate/2-methylcitrate synthase [Acidimicrobiia bacterium]
MADTSRDRIVADLMSSPVVTADPGETVAEAANRMTEKKVGSVVVVDGEQPVGILTERDLVRLAAQGTDPSSVKVSEWMTADPDVVDPTVEVSQAFESLTEHGYRHIPVVSDGRLIGIVSLRDLMRVSAIVPVEAPAADVPRGLEGVVVAETTVGQVRGEEGFYHYRQYDAIELNEKRTLEDVWYLLYYGELPTKAQREEFMAAIASLREIPDDVKELLPSIAHLGDHFRPLDALRSAYSLLASALDYGSWMDVSYEELRDQALRTCSVIPTLLMALWRLRNGEDMVDPDPDLPYAANYLQMLKGHPPSEEEAWAVERYLISTIDHGFNASTFTARVITSTGADLGSAVVGAIGALSGPLHGGAPSRALELIDAIGTEENAEPFLRQMVESGDRIMGFGHRVYKTDDPRSLLLRRVAEKLDAGRVGLARHIEETAVRVLDDLKPGRKLYANVEFYGGVVMEAVGLPPEMFTPTFTSSRVIGWTANILEQAG